MTDFAEGVPTKKIKETVRRLEKTKEVEELKALKKELRIRNEKIWREHF